MSGTKKHRPSTQDGQSLHFADIAGESSGATTGSAAGESSGTTTGAVKVSSDAANAIKSSKVSASGSSEKPADPHNAKA